MGVTPSSVHDEAPFVLSNSICIRLWAFLINDVLPSLSARNGCVDNFAIVVIKIRHDDIAFELRLTNLAFDATAIDGNITKISQQLLSSILTPNKRKQLGCIINERRPACACDECRMGQKRPKKRDVCLDSSNAELYQGTEHLPAHNLVGGGQTSTLNQHGVIMRRDNCTSKSIPSIQTDAVAASGTIYLDLASIRRKAISRIFRRDTTLYGKAANRDLILCQTQLLQGCSSCYLYLRCHNVNASDFFGNCMLHLYTRINLDEVISVFLVDKELCSTCIAIVYRFCQSNGVTQDFVANISWQILCGS